MKNILMLSLVLCFSVSSFARGIFCTNPAESLIVAVELAEADAQGYSAAKSAGVVIDDENQNKQLLKNASGGMENGTLQVTGSIQDANKGIRYVTVTVGSISKASNNTGELNAVATITAAGEMSDEYALNCAEHINLQVK